MAVRCLTTTRATSAKAKGKAKGKGARDARR